jgi:tetratricopeptide (TPR) repeat protein
LFRQSRQDDWGPVLARVASMLRERVGASVGVPPLGGGGPIKSEPADRRPAKAGTPTDRWYGPADLAGHKTDELIAAALKSARRLEESGNLPGAEQKYREALQLAPRHYIALNGLGVVARKMGRTDLAIRCFRRSVAMIDALPVQQLNLADALADAGRFDEALAHYRRAIKLDPAHVAACVQAGRMAQRLARRDDAIAHFQQALAIQPNDEAALIELGHGLSSSGRIDEAIAHGERSVELRPDSAALLIALGKTYCEDQRYADAESCFRRAIARAPAVAAGHFLLAQAVEALGRREEAAASYERAIQLDGLQIDAMIRLAALRRESRQLARAENLLCRALMVRPADPQVLNSLGVVLLGTGAPDEALDCFDDAIQFAPEYVEAHVNRALALLRTGRLAEGWAEYEWRWKCRGAGPSPNAFRLPQWNGDSLAGKSILIYGEQALSDELLFASCYSDVVEQAAGCLIVCDPRLESLFRRSFREATICPAVRGREQQWRVPNGIKLDVQIAAGSLPKHLRPMAESFSARKFYLAADPSAVSDAGKRLTELGEGLKIGIAIGSPPKGGAVTDANLLRSLFEMLGTLNAVQCMWIADRPEFAAVAPIARDSGLALHAWPGNHTVLDVDAMAAGISALDVVIADEGLVAHLAGGLGIPARVLLPIGAPWHWFGGADTTVWFPSLRLFRQQQLDSWDEPIRRLREDLLNLTGCAVDNDRMSHIGGPHWANRASQTQSTHNDGPN